MVDRQASQPMRALGDITEFDGLTTKKQILSVLLEFCESNSICLDSPVVQLEQSFKDFKREKVLLNDIAFVPHEEYIWRNELFGETLGRLCRTLGGAAEEEGMKEKILKNACRTGSGADAFFVIQKLLCIPGTFMAQRSCSDDPPVNIFDAILEEFKENKALLEQGDGESSSGSDDMPSEDNLPAELIVKQLPPEKAKAEPKLVVKKEPVKKLTNDR